MKKEIIIKNEDDAENSEEISFCLVNTILNNLETKKRHIYAFNLIIENTESNYDITIDRKYFVAILLENLSLFEKHELYEICEKILKAIDFLENNKMS